MRSLLALLFVAVLLTPAVVYAENGEDVLISVTPTATKTTESFKEIREKQQAEMKTLRESQKNLLVQQRAEIKRTQAAFKDELQKKRSEFLASQSARKAEFRAGIQAIKDQRKKTIALRIDTKLTDINKKRTDRMAEALDKMSGFLARLQARVDAVSTSGQDTTAATTALTAAQSAIDTAEAAVTSQAAKTYTAEVEGETTLGASFRTTFTQMMTDMKATYDTIHTAKQTLMKAVREVAKLGGIKQDTSTPASASGTPVPSPTDPVSSESAE